MVESQGDAAVSASDPVTVTDNEELQARIAQLEAENERLRNVAPPPQVDEATRSARRRNAGAAVIAVAAALTLALAVPTLWLNRMVTDTDVYVETVAPLASDPAIQNAVASAASAAIIERVDAQSRLKELLPENLQIIATPISQAIDDFITKQSLTLVQSDKFAELWVTVNTVSHKAFVTAVTGRDTGAVGVEAGIITLDVGVLAQELRSRLEAAGLGFVSALPVASIDKQIVLYESPMLAQATTTIDALTRIAYWLPLLGLALAAGAIALAADRRKSVLWLGGALTVGALLPLEAVLLGQYYVTDQLQNLAGIPTDAAQAAYGIIFRDLITATQAAAVLGIVIWLGALLLGPARWATALRTGLTGGLSGAAAHLELGRFGVWMRARKRGLRVAGVAAAVLALLALPAPRTVSAIVWIAVLLLFWVLLVEFFGAEPVDAAEDVLSDEESPEDPAVQM